MLQYVNTMGCCGAALQQANKLTMPCGPLPRRCVTTQFVNRKVIYVMSVTVYGRAAPGDDLGDMPVDRIRALSQSGRDTRWRSAAQG